MQLGYFTMVETLAEELNMHSCVKMHIYISFVTKYRQMSNLLPPETKGLSPAQMEQVFAQVSQFFGLLAEPTRLKILFSLCTGEKSVNAVLDQCSSSQANVSRHLTALHRAGILARRKEGVMVFYSIKDEASLEICQTVCARVVEEIKS
jgi:DNA-binding transcriptional ArsR family regulator